MCVDIVGFYLIHHWLLPLVALVHIVGLAKSGGLGRDARICMPHGSHSLSFKGNVFIREF